MINKKKTTNLLKLYNSKTKTGNGRTKAISTSKIKKITANKKNRMEKGRRAEDFGSNPHSKGELFSRSKKHRLDKNQATRQTTEETKNLKRTINPNKAI